MILDWKMGYLRYKCYKNIAERCVDDFVGIKIHGDYIPVYSEMDGLHVRNRKIRDPGKFRRISSQVAASSLRKAYQIRESLDLSPYERRGLDDIRDLFRAFGGNLDDEVEQPKTKIKSILSKIIGLD